VEDGIRLGQGAIAGVVAERAFVAQRLGRVNVAFDDEVGLPAEALAQAGVGQNSFQFGQNGFQGSSNSVRQTNFRAREP
jgi:hypothetical protein